MRHERLVKFIAGRVERRDCKGKQGFRPAPAAVRRNVGASKRGSVGAWHGGALFPRSHASTLPRFDASTLRHSARASPPSSPPQQRQYRILRYVGRLSHRKHHSIKSGFGNIRHKPAHQRADDPRSAPRRHRVTGSRKDQRHPEDHWQPILEQRGNAAHWSIKPSAVAVAQNKCS